MIDHPEYRYLVHCTLYTLCCTHSVHTNNINVLNIHNISILMINLKWLEKDGVIVSVKATALNIVYLHTRVDQDNRDGLNHKYSNWICIILFLFTNCPGLAQDSSLDSLCTGLHWGHLNLKSYFLTDSFCLRYDNDRWSNAASFWLVQIPSHESVWPMTSLVTL